MWHKYHKRWEATKSLVCVGLDPQLDKLPQCVRGSQNPIWEFNKAIIDATQEYACCYKPNLAFYLADSSRGLEALIKTISHIPKDIPVILDCKVGDVGSTMIGYIKAFFEQMKVDAITINPLMGYDVLEALLQQENTYAFILALTSNPSAKDFFKHHKMDEAVADWLSCLPHDRVGAVVGGTQSKELAKMRSLLQDRLLLIPGVGAQGGDLKSVIKHAILGFDEPRILINSSRGIIFASSEKDFAQAAAEEAKALRNAIRMHLQNGGGS